MPDRPRMKCGHTANGTWGANREPACVICAGISAGAYEVDDDPPSLEDRMMNCAYHREPQIPTNPQAAFFEHRPDRDTDSYYCGCKGWD